MVSDMITLILCTAVVWMVLFLYIAAEVLP